MASENLETYFCEALKEAEVIDVDIAQKLPEEK